MSVARVEAALAPAGLLVLGGFEPAPEDEVPDPCATVLLIGNAGPAMWDRFAAARGTEPDPLDAWTRRIVDAVLAQLAKSLGPARARFPFEGPPYLPFQRWAVRAGLSRSPLGLTVHPVYGLWHAFRAALLFERRFASPAAGTGPCAVCPDKPCLSACPVEAFDGTAYDVAACRGHLATEAGDACRDGGCLARHACPVGRDRVYAPAQARFHMAAFAPR